MKPTRGREDGKDSLYPFARKEYINTEIWDGAGSLACKGYIIISILNMTNENEQTIHNLADTLFSSLFNKRRLSDVIKV